METSVLRSALFESFQDGSSPVVSECNSVQASEAVPTYTKAKFGSVWIWINPTFGNKNEKLLPPLPRLEDPFCFGLCWPDAVSGEYS